LRFDDIQNMSGKAGKRRTGGGTSGNDVTSHRSKKKKVEQRTSLGKDKEAEGATYLWEGNADAKPLIRSDLNQDELNSLIVERDLVEKGTWTRDDRVSVANLLVGRKMLIDLRSESGAQLQAFATRLEVESTDSQELREMLDPTYVQIHTFPRQDANGRGLTYNTWPPATVATPGAPPTQQAFEACTSNVPQQWADLLTGANLLLSCQAGRRAVVPVGGPNGLIGYAISPAYPLSLSFRNAHDRDTALACITGVLKEYFGGPLNGFSYSSFTTVTAAAVYVV
jgi:hypothetical protein